MLGEAGFTIIAITALISTFSAINATILGSGRVNADIAAHQELPKNFTRSFAGKPIGLTITAILSLLLVNTANLQSISTAGSAGFLLIFAAVNYIGARQHVALHSHAWLHWLGTVLCTTAFLALIIQQADSNLIGVAISLSIIVVCFVAEGMYQQVVKRKAP